MVLVASILTGIPVKAATNETYAWPGRPGGNGDGSEEWLQGEYGEAGSTEILYWHEEGETKDLNDNNNKAAALCTTLLSCLVGVTAPETGNYVSVASFVATITQQGYEGAYYVLDSYWSGRQSKIVIKTYKDDTYTKLVKTYTEDVKW